jgi:hypothetical protein
MRERQEMETFVCDNCNGKFIKDWSEDEAVAEMKANGFGEDKTGTVCVCDDCYNKIMTFNNHVPGKPSS